MPILIMGKALYMSMAVMFMLAAGFYVYQNAGPDFAPGKHGDGDG